MKKLVIALAVLLAACSGAANQATVTVENDQAIARTDRTVEVAWDTLGTRIAELTPDNVVVTNQKGEQIPSQVVYNGQTAPQMLIFQTSVDANGKALFTVTKGVRGEYKAKAYGRFVPERKDDYAWENNVVAYRLYGPGLEELMVSSGIDYWAKSTPNLIVDSWYKKDLSGQGSYHLDTGEGCDCYKVGTTVGMGASTPFADGKLWYSRNFAKAETLDNGPIRTSAKVTYAPFDVAGKSISLVKIVSLDAGTHFNKMTDLYAGDADTLSVAAGIVVHEGAKVDFGTSYVSVYEPASDSKGGNDGQIGGGVVLSGGKPQQVADVAACIATAKIGQPFVYYSGAGTSKAGIDGAAWVKIVADEEEYLAHPLKVTVQ